METFTALEIIGIFALTILGMIAASLIICAVDKRSDWRRDVDHELSLLERKQEVDRERLEKLMKRVRELENK